MTKEIKRVINHILEVSQRTIQRELPMVSEAIRRINAWIWAIDYRAAHKMDVDAREEYDAEKIAELKEEIRQIKKEG
jgi:hypothetical protein